MNKEETNPPNPGSPEAVKQGCTCPIMDNHNGIGMGYIDDEGNPSFYINGNCKLHNTNGEVK